MQSPENEFVTVAEAARRVGVDPRQVRRWMEHLPATDKGQDTQRTHKGQPIVLVRLSAVEALRNGHSEIENGTGAKDIPTDSARDVQRTVRKVSDGRAAEDVAMLRQRAAVAEARAELLQSERDALRADLDRQQILTLEALRAANRAQERIEQLEAQNAHLIEALPAPTDAKDNGQDSATDSIGVPSDAPEAAEAQSGMSQGSAQIGEQNDERDERPAYEAALRDMAVRAEAEQAKAPSQRRPWWRFW